MLTKKKSFWKPLGKAWCKSGVRFEFPSLNAFLPVVDLALSMKKSKTILNK